MFFETVRIPPEAGKQPPTVLVKWYDWLRWLLDRVDSFSKNQRFIFGTRLADRAIGVPQTDELADNEQRPLTPTGSSVPESRH